MLMILSLNNVKKYCSLDKFYRILTNLEILFVRGEAQTLTENARDAGIEVQQALEEHCQHQQVVGRVGVHKVTEIVPATKKNNLIKPSVKELMRIIKMNLRVSKEN